MKLPWTWKIKKLYINGTIGFCNINFYGKWNTIIYKVFKFIDTIRKNLIFNFYYPKI